jgi:hypothetical protein
VNTHHAPDLVDLYEEVLARVLAGIEPPVSHGMALAIQVAARLELREVFIAGDPSGRYGAVRVAASHPDALPCSVWVSLGGAGPLGIQCKFGAEGWSAEEAP